VGVVPAVLARILSYLKHSSASKRTESATQILRPPHQHTTQRQAFPNQPKGPDSYAAVGLARTRPSAILRIFAGWLQF